MTSSPTRKTANSSILVGAALFPSVPNFSYPRCPHLDAHGHPYAPMELNLGKKVNNIKKDFFKAGDHICDFIGELFSRTFAYFLRTISFVLSSNS
jgi:hypothetical protein